jgi:hypothetical protein
MNQREWLTSCLLSASENLSEDTLCYVNGRGLPHSLMTEMRVGLWDSYSYEESPDQTFQDRHGSTGQNFHDHICIPLWTPRGVLAGAEWRRWDGEKGVSKFFLPNSKWEPVFTGMTPSVLEKISKGGDVWLVEGVFDLSLCHVVPPKDVVLACGGAKITQNQVNFLSRFIRSRSMVHVCFDMDETGQNMANGYMHPDTGKRVWGVGQKLSFAGVESRIVTYRGGKDPGEIWEAGGKDLLRSAFFR